MWSITCFTLLATAAFCLTTWLSSKTFALDPSEQPASLLANLIHANNQYFSDTVTILRVVQGVASWTTLCAVSASLELVVWALASSNRGSRVLTLLSLSPTTGLFGVSRLVCSRTATPALVACGILRAFLRTACFVGGIVLLVNPSVIKSYYPVETLHPIAGTGPFNGSLVRPFLDRIGNELPYEATSIIRSFIEDPTHAVALQPPSCVGRTDSCTSYLLPGGTYLMWPPMNDSIPSDLVINLEDAPAMRFDFAKGLSPGDGFFNPSDCNLYGEGEVSVKFCLAKSAVHDGSLKAGIYSCIQDGTNGECRTLRPDGSTPNVTTTFSISTYTSSSINGARNGTILEVFNLIIKVEKYPIDHEALKQAMGWLLDYKAVGLPAISSVAFSIAYHPTETFSVDWELSSYKTLKSMIGFIMWYFTENANGNMQLEQDQMNGIDPVVAAKFHVRASVCQAFTRFVISRSSFIIYVVLHTAVLSFCWGAVLWGLTIRSRLPSITAFAAVDFGAKLRRMGDADGWPLEHVAMADDEQRILLALKEERATSRCSM